MSNIMEEALAAVGKIETVPEKIPGKFIVAVSLERDPKLSGSRMTALSGKWQPGGIAVAIENGHCVAANYIFGRFAQGCPKIGPCHTVRCAKCGKVILMPLAVWEAKDNAKAQGQKVDGITGMKLLEAYGHCSCGGHWEKNDKDEQEACKTFMSQVLKKVEAVDSVPKFLPPMAFNVAAVEEAVDLGEDWKWLQEAMANQGKAALPFDKDNKGDIIMHNPGAWFGYTDDWLSTGLFFEENFSTSHAEKGRFNPFGVDGL